MVDEEKKSRSERSQASYGGETAPSAAAGGIPGSAAAQGGGTTPPSGPGVGEPDEPTRRALHDFQQIAASLPVVALGVPEFTLQEACPQGN